MSLTDYFSNEHFFLPNYITNTKWIRGLSKYTLLGCGSEIRYVTGIIGIQPITKVPELPEYIRAIGKAGNDVRLLLDCNKLFNEEVVENLSNI